MVMQLQYTSQRARPDLRTAVSFLCKRVTKPDEDDWKKLTRTMSYLQGTVSLTLRLAADGSGNVEWYIDASHAIHFDMKGHTGGTMTMGKGSIYSTAGGQKLVARSSTESELIAVYDVMPQVLWTEHFLTAQGHKVQNNIVYQDNKSSILLEKNGVVPAASAPAISISDISTSQIMLLAGPFVSNIAPPKTCWLTILLSRYRVFNFTSFAITS
jgi:hypothetical protein